jgi:phosphate transport system permease protein
MESASHPVHASSGLVLDRDSGSLPRWGTWAVVGGAAAAVAAVLLASGVFTVALTLVFGTFLSALVLYAWSRVVEGPRRAKDRLMTLTIAAAFGLAMIPLFSLVFEVAKRGIPGLSVEFFTADARGVVGGGGAPTRSWEP